MLRYKGYSAHVIFDDEAMIFRGDVCGTKDVITFQASSADGLEKAFKESIDDYLQFREDTIDVEQAKRVLSDIETGKAQLISWEEARKLAGWDE